MIFEPIPLRDAFIVRLEPIEDDRGSFARTFCRDEFEARGLNPDVAQCNTSFSNRKGTLRGMHWQAAPHEEAKLVRCIRGALYDVIVDLRPASASYRKWFGIELSAGNAAMLYVPEGFAHGFVTLEDHTETFYQMSAAYAPGYGRGVRFDDPAFGIEWPVPVEVISERDASYPDFVG